jgi:hypothetical protein
MTKLEKLLGLTLLVCLFVLSVVGLLTRDKGVGAYIDAGQVSNFTDVNVTNDLVVDGLLYASELSVSGDVATGNLVQGGAVTAVAAATTTSLTAAQICGSSQLNVTPTVASALSLPVATSTIATCMPKAGDTKEVLLQNLAASALALTITAAEGVELLEPSGGDVVIQQNEWALLKFVNASTTAQTVIVTSLQDAD